MTTENKTNKPKVYFTDFRTVAFGDGLPTKLKKMIRKAGIGEIDMDGKFVAIKLHFGELGNVSYLRPNYARAVADVVKELGGKLISVGSDGTDGPTDAAGGVVDGGTIGVLSGLGLDAEALLADNDSYHALDACGGLVKTGPTGTNVNDLAILFCR